jgi:hypothetical protein
VGSRTVEGSATFATTITGRTIDLHLEEQEFYEMGGVATRARGVGESVDHRDGDARYDCDENVNAVAP